MNRIVIALLFLSFSNSAFAWEKTTSLTKDDILKCDFRIVVQTSDMVKILRMKGAQTGKYTVQRTGAVLEVANVIFSESRSLGVGESYEIQVGGVLNQDLGANLGLSYFNSADHVSLEKNCQ